MIQPLKEHWLWPIFLLAGITWITATCSAPSNTLPGINPPGLKQHLPHFRKVSLDEDRDARLKNHYREEEKAKRFELILKLCWTICSFLFTSFFKLIPHFIPQAEELWAADQRLASDRELPRPVMLKPNRMMYMIRTGLVSFLFFCLAVWLSYPFDSIHLLTNTIIPLALAFLYLIYQARIYYIKTYTLDETGLHITNGFLIQKTHTIEYGTIREIRYKQAFFKRGEGIGNVIIGIIPDSKGNFHSIKLAGISHYRELAMLIGEKAGLGVMKP